MSPSDSADSPSPAGDTPEASACIARIVREDRTALDELHQLWVSLLLGIANRMLGDRREAEEALRALFIRIWQHPGDFHPQPETPIIRACSALRSHCLDRARRLGRRGSSSNSRNPAAVGESGDIPLLSAGDRRLASMTLGRLDKDERAALEQAVFLEHATSATTGLGSAPIGIVKNRLRRLLEKLDVLGADFPECAAWRAFGMLNVTETAQFDDDSARDPKLTAAWRTMDHLAALIAAVTARPMPPRSEQLALLHQELGFSAPPPVRNRAAIAGWITAAVLSAVLVFLQFGGPPAAEIPKPLVQNLATLRARLSGMEKTASATSATTMFPPASSPASAAYAVPIYDSARDRGELIVRALPPAGSGKSYHLWIVVGDRTVWIGRLPGVAAGADSFSFTLGQTGISPSYFILAGGGTEPGESPAPGSTVLESSR